MADRVGLPAGVWHLDPSHSTIGFAVRHAAVSVVRGRFARADATIEIPTRAGAALWATVDVGSLDTGHMTRDRKLCGPLFLDSDEHPTMTFVSEDVRFGSAGQVAIDGALTLRGATRCLSLAGTFHGIELDLEGDTRLGMSLSAGLSRGAYGMAANRVLNSGEVLIGDHVELRLDISAVRRG